MRNLIYFKRSCKCRVWYFSTFEHTLKMVQ